MIEPSSSTHASSTPITPRTPASRRSSVKPHFPALTEVISKDETESEILQQNTNDSQSKKNPSTSRNLESKEVDVKKEGKLSSTENALFISHSKISDSLNNKKELPGISSPLSRNMEEDTDDKEESAALNISGKGESKKTTSFSQPYTPAISVISSWSTIPDEHQVSDGKNNDVANCEGIIYSRS